jgi:hypothetical protein
LRSRALWLASGDNNTTFFHNLANHNRVRKHIWEIKGDNGEPVNNSDAIKSEAVNHFKTFYKASTCTNVEEQCNLIDHYPKMIDDEEARLLFRPVTMEELKLVLFHFKKEKSPGPDGWTTEFFIYFFDLVGQDLLAMVEDTRI